jgi:hypothetical protein
MTDNQINNSGPIDGGFSLFDRGMPECRCPADCGGRPEFGQRLGLAYPTVKPTGTHPPELTYEPRRKGELVFDALNQRLGVFMDQVSHIVYLRPEHGGPEWEADPRWLEKPPTVRQASEAGANSSQEVTS